MQRQNCTRNHPNRRKAGAWEDSIMCAAPERDEAPRLFGGRGLPICTGGLITKKALEAWLLLKSFRLEVSLSISKKYPTNEQPMTVSLLDAEVIAIRDDIETILYKALA
jgi:hypothetical protein